MALRLLGHQGPVPAHGWNQLQPFRAVLWLWVIPTLHTQGFPRIFQGGTSSPWQDEAGVVGGVNSHGNPGGCQSKGKTIQELCCEEGALLG